MQEKATNRSTRLAISWLCLWASETVDIKYVIEVSAGVFIFARNLRTAWGLDSRTLI